MGIHDWLPDWVVPSAAEVDDLDWVAYDACMITRRDQGRAGEAEGIGAAIAWVRGGLGIGPATGRPESPLTRRLVTAEMWAAMALCDGGGTTERTLRGVCEAERVRYYRPLFEQATPEQGEGMYRALGWLIANADGWRGGRKPPLEIPARHPDGSIVDVDRAQELMAVIERTRERAAADVARRRAEREAASGR